jgi:hypothetical protein
MTPESTQTSPRDVTDNLDWQPPMPPTDLIFDDGEPLESNRHRVAMNLLIRSLKHHWAQRNDFLSAAICLFITAANKSEIEILEATIFL